MWAGRARAPTGWGLESNPGISSHRHLPGLGHRRRARESCYTISPGSHLFLRHSQRAVRDSVPFGLHKLSHSLIMTILLINNTGYPRLSTYSSRELYVGSLT